ncbi:MAG: biotin synthase BioB [Ruminococcus flavefaciens]|nr:biotin synthase BioB [Ruminococcus flavefaciens]MCM1230506.1 biotin synthase BioB [Ruminococcus flavefaciens]
MTTLADKIINGFRLERSQYPDFLITADLAELCEGADRIRSALCGNFVELCSIINGRSGKCSEDCKFCAQSAHHCTSIESYDFLDESKIIDECRYNESKGVHRFSIVTAGRTLSGSDFGKALSAYRNMGGKIELCASHGLLTDEQLRQLKEAGVSRYHCNIETSERFFPQICTTHTYADKIACIRNAKKNGLEVCSGGIIGMGENWNDRIDMALTLSELEIRSIPINLLIPIKNTPLENARKLSDDDIFRTVAIFRFINPTAYIRLAGGRNILENSGEKLFKSGANATITGDMLTTSGNNIDSDVQMLTRNGFEI